MSRKIRELAQDNENLQADNAALKASNEKQTAEIAELKLQIQQILNALEMSGTVQKTVVAN